MFKYNFTTFADAKKRSSGRVARQRSAKPCTAVSRLKGQHKKMATDKSIKRPVARPEENNAAE